MSAYHRQIDPGTGVAASAPNTPAARLNNSKDRSNGKVHGVGVEFDFNPVVGGPLEAIRAINESDAQSEPLHADHSLRFHTPDLQSQAAKNIKWM